MCHNTPTADGFDPLVLDRSQAKELRRQFEEVTASSSSSHAATKEGHRAPRQGSWKAEDASEDSGDSAAEEEEEAAEMEEERLENEAVEEEDQESVSKYSVFKKVHASCVKTGTDQLNVFVCFLNRRSRRRSPGGRWS